MARARPLIARLRSSRPLVLSSAGCREGPSLVPSQGCGEQQPAPPSRARAPCCCQVHLVQPRSGGLSQPEGRGLGWAAGAGPRIPGPEPSSLAWAPRAALVYIAGARGQAPLCRAWLREGQGCVPGSEQCTIPLRVTIKPDPPRGWLWCPVSAPWVTALGSEPLASGSQSSALVAACTPRPGLRAQGFQSPPPGHTPREGPAGHQGLPGHPEVGGDEQVLDRLEGTKEESQKRAEQGWQRHPGPLLPLLPPRP